MIHDEWINRAIDYILVHIHEPITVEQIAHHCNFSKFYFSRLFKAQTGESVYEFIKRLKIEQSAFRLKVEQDRKITDVGGDYGYSSSNYSSAFKRHYAVSPVQFRRSILEKSRTNPLFHKTSMGLEPLELCRGKITVEHLPDYRVVYERHKGNYRDLAEHWGSFLEKHEQFLGPETLLIECSYDDPHITDAQGCLFDLCLTIPEACQPPCTRTLRGGRFAIYHFTGHVERIYHAFQSVFTVWLPQSGYQLDERHGFDIYRRIDCDTMQMEVDLCIPIR